ncbi:MAG: hypothetical protein H6926_04485 [Chromatiales bacterium]|nr:hypothetical protein [Chromatiales bacterium]
MSARPVSADGGNDVPTKIGTVPRFQIRHRMCDPFNIGARNRSSSAAGIRTSGAMPRQPPIRAWI